jgi:hypothetical protein
VDTAQISAWFQQNRSTVVVVGGAGIAGLALVARKRNGAAAPTGVTAGAVAPGTMPAGAVVPAGSYDSSAWSAYNALQDEIGTLARQNEAARQTGAAGSGAGAAVTGPIASSLFAPTGSGPLVRYGTTIAEVEGDGTLYGLSLPEWQALGSPTSYSQLDEAPPAGTSIYTRGGNLAAKIKAGATANTAQTSGA